jgi:hypothetical protein
LLHQEERRAHIDGELTVEVFDRRLFNGRRLRDPGVGDEDVETVADDGTDLPGERLGAIRRGEIGAYRLGPLAHFTDFLDDRFGLVLAATVMDKHLRSGPCQRQCGGAPDAARSAGDQSRFARKSSHD